MIWMRGFRNNEKGWSLNFTLSERDVHSVIAVTTSEGWRGGESFSFQVWKWIVWLGHSIYQTFLSISLTLSP